MPAKCTKKMYFSRGCGSVERLAAAPVFNPNKLIINSKKIIVETWHGPCVIQGETTEKW